MYSHILAKNAENLVVLAVAPGHIQTDMGGESAPLTVDDSMPKVLKLIAKATVDDSGKFIDYTGAIVQA